MFGLAGEIQSDMSYPGRLMILHQGHEGSHAIGGALMRDYGVMFIGENWERYRLRGQMTRYLQQAMICRGDIVASQKTVRIVENEIGRALFEHDETDIWKNRTRTLVGLVRGGDVGTINSCQRKDLEKTPFVIALLVRTDLLRWSISSYIGDKEYQKNHSRFPQFHQEKQTTYTYKLPFLKKTAEGLVHQWSRDIRSLKKALPASTPIHALRFITYEEFLENQDRCLSRLMEGLPVGPSIETEGYVKVHDNNLSFVKNLAEVKSAFEIWKLPSFLDVVREGTKTTNGMIGRFPFLDLVENVVTKI
eukprot:CAMPEP_0119122644 /NCGR_PEP_ID=MMETSP1310-20130426/2837_1 /TAXON_ID=464262 /ORGANISM="Genus nov. species nov., Strain RCC2339" /LENGTH=304 /DNA_ID=CAMNT_0007112333 /DNA_START=209 /DNA_END=1123 /DNA_ORIENTATION=+